jgi:hypothetical protein
MIRPEQARVLARERLGYGDKPVEVGLHEFGLGYVAWRIEPVPAGPPPSPGAARLVVDETGELSWWPSVPVDVVASMYATARAAEVRFPADVREVLAGAGWFPGRNVTAAVDAWLDREAGALGGLVPSAAARRALDELGGLVLPQYGPGGRVGGGFTSWIHPTDRSLATEYLHGFGQRLGTEVFPLGYSEDEGANLVADAAGRVFMLHWAGDLLVADGIDQAIVTLVRGMPRDRLQWIREDGSW